MKYTLKLACAVLAGLLFGYAAAGQGTDPGMSGAPIKMRNARLSISWPENAVASWKYAIGQDNDAIDVKLPVFEINGKPTPMLLRRLEASGDPVHLRNGAAEYVYEGRSLRMKQFACKRHSGLPTTIPSCDFGMY